MPALDDRRSAEVPPTVLALVSNVPVMDASACATLEQLWGHLALAMASAASQGIWNLIMLKKAPLLCIYDVYRFPAQDILIYCTPMVLFIQVNRLKLNIFCLFHF